MAKMSRLARMEMMRPDRTREAESRFRDRRGREHYDDGRFAPMRNDTNIEIEGRFRDDRGGERFEDRRGASMTGGYARTDYGMNRYPGMPFPVYRDTDMRRGDTGMDRIGFDANRDRGAEYPASSHWDGSPDYRSDAGYMPRNEMEHHGSSRMSGYAAGADEDGYGASMSMTKSKAESWVHSMRSASGQQGQHYSMDQAKQIMQRHGLDCDPLEFYVAINMMKSDYGKVAKKMGVDKEEFYACMADAFLNDEDAQDGKLMRYYRGVVKH